MRNCCLLESTGYVGLVDEGDEFFVRAAFEVPIAFAEVDVDEDFGS